MNFESMSDAELRSLNNKLIGEIASLDALQTAYKVGVLNSGYGATANEHFRFFKHDHAASITLTGQYLLRSIERQIDSALNAEFGTSGERYLLYIDTDSAYFNLDTVIKKFNVPPNKARSVLEKVTKEKITPIVNKFCDECCKKMNSFENKISFKLEVSAPEGMIMISKKKYALKVESSEGVVYEKPKFKVKGLEMVRSSTPKFIRQKLKDSLDILFTSNEQEVQQYIEDVRIEFNSLPYQQIAFPRSVNNLVEYSDSASIFRKGCPIHVRGALLYNHYLEKLGLTGKYRRISEGEKIKFIYLKTPNKIKSNVIAFPAEGEVPPEFGINNNIDVDMQYQKTMVDAIQIILTAIGWHAVEQSTLESFFS